MLSAPLLFPRNKPLKVSSSAAILHFQVEEVFVHIVFPVFQENKINTNVDRRGTFILVDGRCSNWEKVLHVYVYQNFKTESCFVNEDFLSNKHYLTPLLQKELKNKK